MPVSVLVFCLIRRYFQLTVWVSLNFASINYVEREERPKLIGVSSPVAIELSVDAEVWIYVMNSENAWIDKIMNEKLINTQ